MYTLIVAACVLTASPDCTALSNNFPIPSIQACEELAIKTKAAIWRGVDSDDLEVQRGVERKDTHICVEGPLDRATIDDLADLAVKSLLGDKK